MKQTPNHGDTKIRRLLQFSVLSASPWFRRVLLWLLPLTFLAVFFFLPLSRILSLTFSFETFTLENLRTTQQALLFTFYQAVLSTLLTLLLGLPSAVLFARYDFRGKPLLRALTAVPFMLPTVVVAASFNSLLGQNGLLSTFHSFFFPLSASSNFQPSSFNLHPSAFPKCLTTS